MLNMDITQALTICGFKEGNMSIGDTARDDAGLSNNICLRLLWEVYKAGIEFYPEHASIYD